VVFADGMMQRGVVGRARVTIGGMTTVRPITFGLIDTVSCDKRVPRCPGSAGIRGRIGVGEYGILGVGLTRDPGGLANPLLALARPYARRWTIELQNAGGSLILRPTFPSKPVARFRLKRDGRDPSGAAAWKDARVKVCWAAVDLRGDACEPTVFDSGSVTMLWYGGLLSHADTSIDEVLVNPGEYIAAWQPGAQTPFYSFTSGDEFSHDSVMAVHGGHPLVIAAVQTFLNFSVAYDDSRGEIALYPQSAP
jgi:hypothetical protein